MSSDDSVKAALIKIYFVISTDGNSYPVFYPHGVLPCV